MSPQAPRPLVALLAALAALGLAAASASATTIATRGGRATCRRAGSRTLASSPTARIYAVTGADDGEYGAPVTVYGCLRRRDRRRVVLQRFSSTRAVTVVGRRLAGRYAALAESVTDVACSKYMGAAPECTTARLASFDLTTGRVRALGSAPVAAFALTPQGWLAWVAKPDPLGLADVVARDSRGVRRLDRGAVDPASLSSAGSVVSWVRDGVEQTAALR